MYSRIEWMSYQFVAPKTFSAELYSAAKSSPKEFRRQFIGRHLRQSSKQVGLMILAIWGLGALFGGIAYLLDGSKRGSSSYSVEETLVMLTGIAAISGLASAGSFAKYAIVFRGYWLRVLAAARDSESYSEFLIIAWERRLISKQPEVRKLAA